jgi:hypothetical protein
MNRDRRNITQSIDIPASNGLSFKDEISALRAALSHLQESFAQADALDEQLKLSSAISLLTSSLARLVRAQEYINKNQPSALDMAAEAAIQDILKEWGWT